MDNKIVFLLHIIWISTSVQGSQDEFLLFTDSYFRGIYKMNIATETFVTIPVQRLLNPIAVDYDYIDKKIYWTDVSLKEIRSVYVNGSGETTLRTVPGSILDGIAVDSVSRLVFYTDMGNAEIVKMNMDGSGAKVVFDQDLEKPRAILCDPDKMKLYWTDWGSVAKIETANYDGSNRQVIIDTGLEWPNAIVVDHNAEEIYWVDAKLDKMEKCNLDGSNRKTIRSGADGARGVHYFGLTLLEDTLFYTDWFQRSVMSISTSGGDVATVGPSVFGRVNDIHVYSAKGVSTKNLDCLVTEWTNWSGTFGFGQTSRERRILRWSTGTGDPCPTELQQVKKSVSGTPPNTTEQAKHFTTDFFRFYNPTGRRSKRDSKVGELRDLLVILDNSGSIGSGPFTNAKTQIGRLLGLLCPQPDPFDAGYQQVAFITFSSQVYEIFQFNSYTGVSAIQAAVNQAPYVGSSTCTATAFKYVDDMFQKNKGSRKRPGVKQEVLIITDGESNCGGSATNAAHEVHEIADVFGLMLGNFDDNGKKEVTNYVSMPASQHLFYLKSFSEIKTFVDTVESEMKKYSAPCAPFDTSP